MGNRIMAVHLASSQHKAQAINNASMANTVDSLTLALQMNFVVHSGIKESTEHKFLLSDSQFGCVLLQAGNMIHPTVKLGILQ